MIRACQMRELFQKPVTENFNFKIAEIENFKILLNFKIG